MKIVIVNGLFSIDLFKYLLYISAYENKNKDITYINCNDKVKPKYDEDEACNVDINSFGDCTPENQFGYPEGNPCVFLKLNKASILLK